MLNIVLVSNEMVDPLECEISTKAARSSGMINDMISYCGIVSDRVARYTIKQANRQTLPLIVEYLEHHSKHEAPTAHIESFNYVYNSIISSHNIESFQK